MTQLIDYHGCQPLKEKFIISVREIIIIIIFFRWSNLMVAKLSQFGNTLQNTEKFQFKKIMKANPRYRSQKRCYSIERTQANAEAYKCTHS
jgi:hypothetical protein